VLVFIALVMLVPLLDLAVYELNVPEIEKHTFSNLNSIAKLKTEQIEHWLNERSGDAHVLGSDEGFARDVEQFLLGHQHDAAILPRIRAQLASLQTEYGFDSIMLLDTDGRLITSLGKDIDTSQTVLDLLHQVLIRKQIVRSTLYLDEDDHIHIDWLVPLTVADRHGKRLVAVAVLRAIPDKFLYPLIQTWPMDSRSGENLLVKRDGESILHLSPLRREPGAALTLKMHDPLLPAAIAIRENKPGKVAGMDYRHKRVLAVYRPVTGTAWHLIAKIDRDEVMVPLWNMLYWISMISALAVGLIASVLLLFHRQMQRSHKLALRTIAAEATQESELRYRTLVKTIPDMVWLKNAEGIYLGCNAAFERLYGAGEAELIGKSDYDFVDREVADSFREHDLKAMTDDKPSINEEWLTFADNGYRGRFETVKTPMKDVHGNLVGVLGIARDITQRKLAEETLRKLSQAVEQSTSSIVITDLDANIEYANAAFAKESGYSLDEVIGSNPRLLHSGKTPKATYADMWAHLTKGESWVGEFINRRKNGSEYIELATISPVFQTDGTRTNYLAIKENITERKRMTEALRKSGEDMNRLLNSMAEGVYGIDNDGICTFVNRSFLSMLGYQSDTEVLGKHIHDLIHHSHPDGSPYPESECTVHYAHQSGHSISSTRDVFWRKDGIAVPVEFWSHAIASEGATIGAIVTFFDITERQADEARIARLTQLYAALSQCNLAIVRCTNEQDLFRKICQNAVQSGGMTMAWIGMLDETSKQVSPVAVYGDGADHLQGIRVSADAGEPFGQGPTGIAIRENRPYWCQDFEHDPALKPWRELGNIAGWKAAASLPLHRNGIPSGVLVLYSDTVNAFDDEARRLLTEMASDISFALDNFAHEAERKRAVQEIEFKNIILQTQQNTTLDAILVIDENRHIISYNQQFLVMWATPDIQHLIDRGEDAPLLKSVIDQCLDPQAFLDRVNYLYEHHDEKSYEEIPMKSGVILERYSAPLTGTDGHYYGRVWYFRDISKRKHAEQELIHSEQRFRGLVEQSLAGIYIIQDGKFVYVNPRAAEIVGESSVDDLIGQDIFKFVVEDERDTVSENIRKLLNREIPSVVMEFRVVHKQGHTITIGANASYASYYGKPAIIGLIQDISEKKRSEERIQNYVAQLKATFLSTVQLATSLSEMRDPYTAGHERRVSDIAVAIANEMGLDEQRVEGIKVAGYLHDIGKISIPAEILVKPGRLTATEYALVQGHAQASYEVLKIVPFPWPVATIALQHHERMDGSGYPNGLKGDDILLESRILAVADVVEAMASHRPYRAGLGIESALAEIERGNGTIYDPEVATACLRMFREKNFVLPPL
jgi:PAS domain S-box-containing protein